jgi:ribA/ribD-fused uncharacterized protein
MKYNIETLINNNEFKKYIFFWGNQPSKDGSVTKSCFSQWWECPFTVEGIIYKTAEHWMMSKKAALFGDKEAEKRIIDCLSPAEAKKIGREVKGYNDVLWLEKRFEIVVKGNFHKFSQNEEMKSFLLKTGDRILVEASPVDAIWGIGMAADNPEINNPENWEGLNLLGFALMEVREMIKESN